jgi:hypothetical protein
MRVIIVERLNLIYINCCISQQKLLKWIIVWLTTIYEMDVLHVKIYKHLFG